MAAAPPGKFGRFLRRLIFWGVTLAVVLGLAAGGALLYLQKFGVPRFGLVYLQKKLADQGLDVRIGNLRLSGLSRLIGDDVEITSLSPALSAQSRIGLFDFRIQRGALKRFKFQPEQLSIRELQVNWKPDSPSARANSSLVNGLQFDLRFPQRDEMELTALSGRLLNVNVHATGRVSHFSATRNWPWWSAREKKVDWPARIEAWLDQTRKVTIAQPSVLELSVEGDGRDPDTFRITSRLEAAKAEWPGHSAENVRLLLTQSQKTNGMARSQVDLQLSADAVSGLSWRSGAPSLTAVALGSASNQVLTELTWRMKLASFAARTMTGQALTVSSATTLADARTRSCSTRVSAEAPSLQTPWGEVLTNRFEAELAHRLSFRDAWRGKWEYTAGGSTGQLGSIQAVRMSGIASPSSLSARRTANASWGFWEHLAPIQLEWELGVSGVNSPKLRVDSLSCGGTWRAPDVTITNLQSSLYGGQIKANARLNIPSRELTANTSFKFDAHQVSPLLTTNSQRWLAQFSWSEPPDVTAAGRLLLPAWTNRRPNWRLEVMPTIQLSGQFTGSNGAFRGVAVDQARSHFHLTNQVWYLPDLFVQRTNAESTLEYVGDMDTHEYRWRVDARLDPRVVKPLIEGDLASRVVDQFEFSTPASVQGEVWGRWRDASSVRFAGRVAATNFAFRGEACSEFRAGLQLTESALGFSDVFIRRNEQEIRVPGGTYDLLERVVLVTNAVSTMDPSVVTKVIGPKIHEAMEPYRFGQPPTVRVNGRLPTIDIEDADVRFDVVGPAFNYWKFHVRDASGDVHWRGTSLTITNVQANFYDGQLEWHGEFDFSAPVGAALTFNAAVKNARFHDLMSDLGRPANKLEGTLDTEVKITKANSDDWRSWQGSGWVRLRDGFLWDIPIFGFFSPVLNKIVPGLGNSPISAGDATFTIDQSVVETEDLELKSSALRLEYIGTVDVKGRVDARMQAEILRDAWGVGRAVSWMLKPLSKAFEYKITGTVYQPKSEPVYIPKVLLWPLHPFRTIKKIFTPEKKQPPAETRPNVFSEPEEE